MHIKTIIYCAEGHLNTGVTKVSNTTLKMIAAASRKLLYDTLRSLVRMYLDRPF